MTDITPLLRKAIETAGSQAKLAQACGVVQQSISAALNSGRVSAEMAVKIDRATNGAVPHWQLRPDLWTAPEEVAS
jgi:DNA-binding transcriptional regulator YdaS (Cro superfamily)